MTPASPGEIYQRLFADYGPQHWWPAESPFEVMVGAILTQNTAWTNVEKAIDNLRSANCLSPEAIRQLPAEQLADLIRPSGYFNVKARRLHNYCHWYLEMEQMPGLQAINTTALRAALLSINGIGPETADDILLYAFQRPVFVIDAYTRRLFSRLGLIRGNEGYEALRAEFESALGLDLPLFKDYHALIVQHAKAVCRKQPDCQVCQIRDTCQYPNQG